MTYSFKDFSNADLTGLDLAGHVIVCSWFVGAAFPEGMSGVTFTNCRFDDEDALKENNSLDGGEQRQFKKMEDGSVWLVDREQNPVQRLKTWNDGGLS